MAHCDSSWKANSERSINVNKQSFVIIDIAISHQHPIVLVYDHCAMVTHISNCNMIGYLEGVNVKP